MKNLAQFVRWATPVISCGMLLASAAYAQGGIRVAPGTPGESRRLLTNESIVQMVKQGEPDPAIIAAIRANPVKFDLSRQQRLALHHEGVSEQVLNAMVTAEQRQRRGLGGAVGPNAGELSPQPYPPKSRVNSAGQASKEELSPQPYPPKNGTLLTPGAQHTMLGTQASSPSANGSKSVLPPGVQRPAITGGTMGDGSVRPATSPAAATPAVAPAGPVLTKGGTIQLQGGRNHGGANPSGNGGAGIRQHHGGANPSGNGGAGIRQHHGGANPSGNGGAGIRQHHGGANPSGNGGAGIRQHHGAIPGDGSVRPAASTATAARAGALSGTGTTAVTANQATPTMPTIMQKTSPVAVGTSQPMIAQGNAGKLGAPPPAITLGGAPEMRQAPTSAAQRPAAPNSPLSTSGTAAESLSNVAIATSIPSFLSVTKTAGDTALQSKQVQLSPTPGAQGNASSNAVSALTPSASRPMRAPRPTAQAVHNKTAMPYRKRSTCQAGPPAIDAANGLVLYATPAAAGYMGGIFVAASFPPTGNVFTAGKRYVITGCNFGTTPGQVYLSKDGFERTVKLYPHQAPGPRPLYETGQPLENSEWGLDWSDTRIDAVVDPSAIKLQSLDGVVLVVVTSTGEAVGFGWGFAP